VILHEDHSAPVVAAVVWYHVGSKNEELHRTGFAHCGTSFERPKPVAISIPQTQRVLFEDKVKLPRLFLDWLSAPMQTCDDAVLDVLSDILSSRKTSRLYKSLVYEKQIAQNVGAYQSGMEIGGQFEIDVTAKSGKTLVEIEAAINEEIEKLLKDGETQKEIDNALISTEAGLINRFSTVLGKANQLSSYFTFTGDPEKQKCSVSRKNIYQKIVLC
jgi:zinc protease